MSFRTVVSALGLACGAAVWGQEPAASPVTGQSGVYLLQALLSLTLVVALIYAAYWFLRRAPGGWPASSRQARPAQHIQALPLNAGNVLHVVKLHGRLWMFTSGPQGVTSLASDLADDESTGGTEDAQ